MTTPTTPKLKSDAVMVPSVDMAIKAIEEKKLIKRAESPEDYQRFCDEMDAVDRKYGFKA